jgi:hypothetical protein
MTARVGRLVMLAAMVAVQTAPAAPVPWSTPRQGAFVMALAAGPGGSVWVGTEGRGVWRWQAGAREPWRQFTNADGLGDDNAYALTIDRAGRAWVGHLDWPGGNNSWTDGGNSQVWSTFQGRKVRLMGQ